jgi:RecA/RadA recombinase
MAKKKAEAKVETRADKARAVVTDLQGRYKGAIQYGKDVVMPWMLKRLPSGILALDIATNGGAPAGGMTMIVGPESTGKNWLTWQYARRQQELYGDDTSIGIVNLEMVVDKEQAQSCDVALPFSPAEVDAFVRSYRESEDEEPPQDLVDSLTREVGLMAVVNPDVAEKNLQIAIDMIGSRAFDMVVIDSFGAILTEHDDDSDLQDASRPGGQAGLNTKFSRKLYSAMAPNELGEPNLTAVFGINQVRANMDRRNKYSPTTIESGGHAIKHARFLTIEMHPTGKVKDNKGRVIGKIVTWKIVKQKAGGYEGATGSFEYIYTRCGVWRAKETLITASEYGIVSKKGSWFYYNDEALGQGTDAAAAKLEKMGVIDEIEKATLNAAGVHVCW